MFFATIFFMVVKIGVKMLPHIPPMEIVFFRCIISFIISSVIGNDNLGLSILNHVNFGKYIVFLGSEVFVNDNV